MYLSVSVYVCIYECRCPHIRGTGSLEIGVTGSCEASHVGLLGSEFKSSPRAARFLTASHHPTTSLLF